MKAVFPFWPHLSDSRLTRRLGAATSVADCRPHWLQSVCDMQIVSTVDLKKLQKPQGTTFLMKLDVVHILGVFSNAMQITFLQMCLRRDVFPAARIGNVFCVESGGKDGMRLTGREFPLLEKEQGKTDVPCNVTARLFAKLGVHLSQFSEPQVHEIPDTCVVTTATRWERLLIAGSHGFNLIAR